MLALLASPVTRYAAIGLAIISFIAYQRHDAAQDATREAQIVCQQQVEERTNAEIERQRDANETVLVEAQRRAEEATAEIGVLEAQANELLERIEASGDSCPIDTDTLRRLRDIR